ncbi:C6 transcription factor protein [Rutstroemia sp. NJR-2017a BBW]|nr:C6 transcription factor protein [Rutstroemia sp. NJR-2017a BBW]
MPDTPASENVIPIDTLKPFSCLGCRQRKVKCDRRTPCSNCKKAAKECSFIAPVRGKRKRTKSSKEGLRAKLKRYEEMLKTYGAKVEPSEQDDSSDEELQPDADVDMNDVTHSDEKAQSSKHLLSDFDQFQHPQEEEETPVEYTNGRNSTSLLVDTPGDDSLILGTYPNMGDLTALHPPMNILKKMWQIYLDRIDAAAKLLHLPTFWSQLTGAIREPHDTPKSLEAIIFSFYLVVYRSLEEDECLSLLGEQKSTIFPRYKLAAHQALIKANFLNTSSLMTLQAFLLYLMGVRGNNQSDSLYILSGVAVRLARRMGLHRDGQSLGLSPFETEMRRRLWWLIVNIDCRTSEFSGMKPSGDLFLSDTKVPLNIDDEQLSPEMTEPPSERTGITSLVLCLLRCDITDAFRRINPQFLGDARRDKLENSSITLSEKDIVIQQTEELFETKYIRYCDPANSLHYLTSLLARSVICKLKLIVHNPRQFADRGMKVPQAERDIIFNNAIKLLEYSNLTQTSPQLRKYKWSISTSYLWDTLLCVLIEARHRKTGPEVDKTWELVGKVYETCPQIVEQTNEALYKALGNWTLQVWEECILARRENGMEEWETPWYVAAIRRSRRPLAKRASATEFRGELADITEPGDGADLGYDGNPLVDFDPAGTYDFSNLLSFDLEPDEWVQWEQLLAGQTT